MSRFSLAARLAVLGLLLAFLVAPQAFAPVFAPLNNYGAPAIYDQGNLLELALSHLWLVLIAAAASTGRRFMTGISFALPEPATLYAAISGS